METSRAQIAARENAAPGQDLDFDAARAVAARMAYSVQHHVALLETHLARTFDRNVARAAVSSVLGDIVQDMQ